MQKRKKERNKDRQAYRNIYTMYTNITILKPFQHLYKIHVHVHNDTYIASEISIESFSAPIQNTRTYTYITSEISIDTYIYMHIHVHIMYFENVRLP